MKKLQRNIHGHPEVHTKLQLERPKWEDKETELDAFEEVLYQLENGQLIILMTETDQGQIQLVTASLSQE